MRRHAEPEPLHHLEPQKEPDPPQQEEQSAHWDGVNRTEGDALSDISDDPDDILNQDDVSVIGRGKFSLWTFIQVNLSQTGPSGRKCSCACPSNSSPSLAERKSPDLRQEKRFLLRSEVSLSIVAESAQSDFPLIDSFFNFQTLRSKTNSCSKIFRQYHFILEDHGKNFKLLKV